MFQHHLSHLISLFGLFLTFNEFFELLSRAGDVQLGSIEQVVADLKLMSLSLDFLFQVDRLFFKLFDFDSKLVFVCFSLLKVLKKAFFGH